MTTTEEETVTLASREFRRRRFSARLRRWRPFLLAGLAVVLLATGIWLVFFSSAMTVRGVQVTGNTTLSATRVEAVAGAPLGKPLARADLGAIQARVEALPAVRSASVSRSWPHTVHVDVVERTPVAVVNRGSGLQAVDDQGVLFGRYASQPADLPLVRTAPDVKADALAEAARVVGSLRSDIAARVDFIDVQTIDRIRLRLDDGRVVSWGSAEHSAQKAEVLAVLLQQKAQEIDVSVPGRPTTR
ncbi:cell division protein FtsQ/DivIB [Marmoricola sp. RAF53]|uniref:cell division protein FtsQ/DivIB n=1 Tax=Marmoricola sp. RAF53 TaxID=3233059 RepID=UPI003F95A800